MKNLNDNVDNIASLYFADYQSLREIAALFECSAMAIQSCLKRHGHDTSKRKYLLKCARCQKEIKKTRRVIRRTIGKIGLFCDARCYQLHLTENAISPGSEGIRHSNRVAREIMARVYGNLPVKSIVHHVDGNAHNNDLSNLMLLDSQQSHLMIHRGFGAPVILFDGNKSIPV